MAAGRSPPVPEDGAEFKRHRRLSVAAAAAADAGVSPAPQEEGNAERAFVGRADSRPRDVEMTANDAAKAGVADTAGVSSPQPLPGCAPGADPPAWPGFAAASPAAWLGAGARAPADCGTRRFHPLHSPVLAAAPQPQQHLQQAGQQQQQQQPNGSQSPGVRPEDVPAALAAAGAALHVGSGGVGPAVGAVGLEQSQRSICRSHSPGSNDATPYVKATTGACASPCFLLRVPCSSCRQQSIYVRY